jgi:hypothetical protein
MGDETNGRLEVKGVSARVCAVRMTARENQVM